jgi:N-acetylneuraminate synthase
MSANPFITIAKRKIGLDFPPYIIAEMSANHNGDIENAYKIILSAKKSGVDAVKMQTYTPDTITLNVDNEDFRVEGGLWDGRNLYDLYKEAHTPFEWHKPIFEFAKKNDVVLFSTPFDHTAVDLLEDLNTPAYKIASFELVDLPLIKYVASTKKPMIISTGMASIEEIHEAITVAKDAGCKEIAILRTVSGYPAPAIDYNLNAIPDMMNRFGLVTGLSDHTIDNITAYSSIALGARIIEKHFTLDRNGGGPDDKFSLEQDEFGALCQGALISWQSLGGINYSHKESEKGSVKFRRSLYFIKEMQVGDIITATCIKSVRPGFGLAPNNFDQLIGKRLNSNVSYGTPVNWALIEN